MQELLLRGVQEGVIRDGQGREASLRNAIVVFTTNTNTNTAASSSSSGNTSTGARTAHGPTTPPGASASTTSVEEVADHRQGEQEQLDATLTHTPTHQGHRHHPQPQPASGHARASSSGAWGLVPELQTAVDRVVHFTPLDQQERELVVRRHVYDMAELLRPAGVEEVVLRPEAATWLAGQAAAAAAAAAGVGAGGGLGGGGMAGCEELLRRQLLEPLAEQLVAIEEEEQMQRQQQLWGREQGDGLGVGARAAGQDVLDGCGSPGGRGRYMVEVGLAGSVQGAGGEAGTAGLELQFRRAGWLAGEQQRGRREQGGHPQVVGGGGSCDVHHAVQGGEVRPSLGVQHVREEQQRVVAA